MGFYFILWAMTYYYHYFIAEIVSDLANCFLCHLDTSLLFLFF